MSTTTRPYEPLGVTTATWRTAPVVEVNVYDLEFQHDLSLRSVVDSLRGRSNHVDGDLPFVVAHAGVLYVEDGHHRIAAAVLRGEEMLRVRLLEA